MERRASSMTGGGERSDGEGAGVLCGYDYGGDCEGDCGSFLSGGNQYWKRGTTGRHDGRYAA